MGCLVSIEAGVSPILLHRTTKKKKDLAVVLATCLGACLRAGTDCNLP